MKPLTHTQARERIEKARTGLLSATELAALDAHLDGCSDCRAYEIRFRRKEHALRDALGREPRPPDAETPDLESAVRRIRSRVRTHRAFVFAGRAVKTAGLASLIIALSFSLNWLIGAFPQTTPEPAATSAAPAEGTGTPILGVPEPGPSPAALDESPADPTPEPSPEPGLGYTPFSRQLRLTLGSTDIPVNAVVFAPDGVTVAAAYADGTVRIWRARDGALLAEMDAHIKQATSLAFSADGSILVTGGRDGAVKLWLAKSGVFIKTVFTSEDIVEDVQFSPNGELLAVTLNNFSVALVRIRDGSLTETLPSLVRMTVSSDEGRNSTLTVSGESAIWLDAEDERPLGLNVQGYSSRSTAVVLSADGTLLASTAADGRIYLWRIYDITIVEERYDDDHPGYNLISRFISGNLMFTLEGHTAGANQLDFSANGEYLVSAAEDGTIIFWSLADGSPAETLNGHEGPVNTIDVSPDDTFIASGSDDGTVRIWSLTEY